MSRYVTTCDQFYQATQDSKQRKWCKSGHFGREFWGRDRQCTFFDVRVFNPFTQSYHNTPLAQCYRRKELEKRRTYDERVREIEHGSFSPLVFTTSGGKGTTATVVYKRIASMISEKYVKTYSKIKIRNFSLLRSAIMCIRGSRSAFHCPAGPLITTDSMDLACSEGGVIKSQE